MLYVIRFLMLLLFFLDTRETSFVSAITAAGVTYAVTRACTMGDLVECSCDKNHILRRLQYNTNEQQQQDEELLHQQQHHHQHNAIENIRSKRKHNRNDNYLRNRNIYRNVVLPEGDWEWGGCGDNVNFGFRKSKDFLDSRYRRRSDIKTLVKLHNNNAGRLVSDFWLGVFLRSNLLKKKLFLGC